MTYSPSSTQTYDPVQALVDANSSQATAVAAIPTAEYYSSQFTATIEAQYATATEHAWLVQATQQAAQIPSTARAWDVTA